MIRILALSFIALLTAAPALADDIHIKITGKDDATLQRDIHLAARQVCDANRPGRLTLEAQSCIGHILHDAQVQLVQARAATETRLAQAK
jgi:hypothetical protein